MEIGMMALLSKTVSLMESLGFMWLVHTGFELNLWERLLEGKTKEELRAESPDWDETLLDHWLEQARIQELVTAKNGNFQLSKLGKAVYSYRDYGLRALYKEFVLHWGPCFGKLPDLMKKTIQPAPLAGEMEDELIAKASKASEPFVWPLLKKKCEKEGWQHVLDVGCGEAAFLQRLASEFPELRGVGLEINPQVAQRAEAQMISYQGRIRIEVKDVLDFAEGSGSYDCCLLNNNIYYFDRQERIRLLNSLYKILRPGGRIGILTALRGVTPSLQIIKTHIPQNLMSFFLACHQDFAGLPFEDEMNDLLAETGFIEIEANSLPFKVSHYFFAKKPS